MRKKPMNPRSYNNIGNRHSKNPPPNQPPGRVQRPARAKKQIHTHQPSARDPHPRGGCLVLVLALMGGIVFIVVGSMIGVTT